MILKPGSRFAGIYIGGSKAMRDHGIPCEQSMNAIERRKKKTRVSEKQSSTWRK